MGNLGAVMDVSDDLGWPRCDREEHRYGRRGLLGSVGDVFVGDRFLGWGVTRTVRKYGGDFDG